MIAFQEKNDGWQIDLTAYGMTFNEFSDYFTKLSQKNYSFPISLDLDDDLSEKLGLLDVDNVTDYKVRIEGYLIVDDYFYETYMLVKEEEGGKVELSFFYGDEILSVFNTRLNQLPFPIIDTSELGLNNYSQLQLSKEWPAATHNFPKVYRPQLKEKENYTAFLGWVNNRSSSGFKNNEITPSPDGDVTNNFNVVCPMPYLLEILKVGFATEGKQIRGEFVDDDLIRKTVIVPQKFLEYYSDPTQREYWQFSTTPVENLIDDEIRKIHTLTRVPEKNGTYSLSIKLNIPKNYFSYFKLTVDYGADEVLNLVVKNNAVILDRLLEFNVENDTFFNITIRIETSNTERSIKDFNMFKFDYNGGRLNVFPEVYSLSDVMPDMLFRTFYNSVKEFYNLDVTFAENAVYLNYFDNSMQRLVYEDHTEFQIKKPLRKLGVNNLFKLTYPDKSQVLVNKDGVTYNEDAYTSSETTNIDFSILPVKVVQNEDVVTGVHPENDNELLIGIYNGLQNEQALLLKTYNGTDQSIENIYKNYHRHFITFRANAEIIKEKFMMSVHEPFNLKKGVFKYNKKHLIKSLTKRRLSKELWQVTAEMESF